MSSPYENTDDDGSIKHADGTVETTDVVSHFPKWPEAQGDPQEVVIRRPLP